MNKLPLIIIGGATAVGKTDISVKLALDIGGEIISGDSMQVYKGMDIGTAKISQAETKGIPHHLIDILDPTEDFNVFTFQKLALKAIDSIYNNGHIPIIVGGTGFYIQSVLYDIDFEVEETDKDYREYIEKLADIHGNIYIHNMLKEVDPESAAAIHFNNVKRVVRALGFYHETGQKISEHNEEQKSKESPFNYVYFVMNRERSEIYERINKRVDLMIKNGLVDEVKMLLNSGLPEKSTAMQGLGYKEIVSYLNGDCSLEDAVETVKKQTRHFSKRQITWFKREPEAIWLDYKDYKNTESIKEKMIEILKEKKIV